jgi:hypothetical protein
VTRVERAIGSRATAWATENLATQLAALQAELVVVKAETAAKVASLEDTIANLAHENALLKRRLYGNRTERSQTSKMQLALGDLLAGETQLQKDLDDAVEKAKDAVEPEPKPAGPRATPEGRRDLSVSKLPRVLMEIFDEQREASGCRRIGVPVEPRRYHPRNLGLSMEDVGVGAFRMLAFYQYQLGRGRNGGGSRFAASFSDFATVSEFHFGSMYGQKYPGPTLVFRASSKKLHAAPC